MNPHFNELFQSIGHLGLFENGEHMTSTGRYRPRGERREMQHELCRWRGRFQDGNHYSIEHDGKA